MDQRALESRRKFFFAETAAGMYDCTIEMVVPNYEVMHKFLLCLLEYRGLSADDTVFDVGSGTGTDSIAILKRFPSVHVVSMDLCAPIQEVHRHKLKTGEARLAPRSTLHCADVMGYPSGKSLLHGLTRGKTFDAVVTSLTVHHFGHREKRRFYKMMYDILRPKGCLINADLFSHSDKGMSQTSLEFDLSWMKDQFLKPQAGHTAIPTSVRRTLLRRWIRHYRMHNRLEPLEDAVNSMGQLSMIREAGFRRVSVPYRYSLSGIIHAVK